MTWLDAFFIAFFATLGVGFALLLLVIIGAIIYALITD